MSQATNSFLTTKGKLALLLRRRIGSQREDKDFDQIVRWKTLQIFCFSMTGVVTTVIMGIASWLLYSSKNNTDAYYDDPQVPVRVLDIMYVGQALLSASTFVCIVLISQKYQLELIRKRAEWSGTNIFEVEGFRGVAVRDTNQRDYFLASYNFWRSKLVVSYTFEVVVHLIHPVLWMASYSDIPTTPATYSYTSINVTYKLFQAFVFLRLYLVYTLLHVWHPAYQSRFEVVNNDPDLLSVGFNIKPSLTLKMVVHAMPTSAFIGVSILSIVIFGFLVFQFERVEGQVDPKAHLAYIRPENSFWFAFVTLRTIGFGEFSPRTPLGRVAAAMCVIVGIATAGIFSGVLVAQIPLSKELKQAVEFLQTSDADNRLRSTAAELIQTAWRIHCLRKARTRLVEVGLSDGPLRFDPRVVAGVREGDVLVDPETAKEQASAAAGLSRFGIDHNNRGHKSDRLYFAIKQFRYARKEVLASFTQANDVVVNQKMDSLMALSRALQREYREHHAQFEVLEKEILESFSRTSQQVLFYKKLGHVPL